MRQGSISVVQLLVGLALVTIAVLVAARMPMPPWPARTQDPVVYASPAPLQGNRKNRPEISSPSVIPAVPSPRSSADAAADAEVLLTGTLAAETHAADPRHAETIHEVIAPPPGIEPALAVADPHRLRIYMDHGIVGFSSKVDAERVKGLRLIQVAAALGYASARSLIVQEYPSSPVVRAIVPPADVVRDALDPFTGDAAAVDDPKLFAALATYFGARQALATFAAYLVDAMRDDTRLQSPERLQPMFDMLARVPGACLAVARIIAIPYRDDGPECPAEFRQRVLGFARSAGTTGRDATARQLARSMMERLDRPAEVRHSTEAPPEGRTVPVNGRPKGVDASAK